MAFIFMGRVSRERRSGFGGFLSAWEHRGKRNAPPTRQQEAPMIAPWWRPDRLARRRVNLAARTRILGAVRDFFAASAYLEVDTPALQASPGLEPHLRAFGTVLHDPRDGSARPLYLHTSPEFAMKKLLAGGLPRIWQLAHAYRDGDLSATRHPEFSMLEWYRAGAGYRDLMAECEALLRAVQAAWRAAPLRRLR